MIYPPRPTHAIPPDALKRYETWGWDFQPKYNGICTVVRVGDASYTRKGSRMYKEFNLPLPNDTVVVGELMKDDHLMIFDILQWGNVGLVGTCWGFRKELLHELARTKLASRYDVSVVRNTEHISILDFWEDIRRHYAGGDVIEGIVLRDPHGVLEHCDEAKANKTWILKCRFPNAKKGIGC